MDTPIQVNGSHDPFPIPFRKFFNLWLGLSVNIVLTIQDVIDVSIMKTVVSVGNIRLENRAILLPSIHETFMGHVTDMS